MTCQGYDNQLGDFVDGALDAPGREAFELHLTTCERCQALVADFRAIRHAALTLEPRTPPAAVWSGIAAAIETRPSRGWWTGVTWWQPVAALAAAVLVTASLAWVGARLAPVADSARTAAARPPSDVQVLVDPELDTAASHLTSAIAGLEQITDEEGGALDSDTAEVIQVNLTAIDTAIGESRAALTTEPDSELAIESFFRALRHKLALLQDAVALINEMRKGNPEGAARIVSGLNP